MNDWIGRLKWLIPAVLAVGGLLYAGNWYMEGRAEAKLAEGAAREASERLIDALSYFADDKGITHGDLIAKAGAHLAEVDKLKMRIRMAGKPRNPARAIVVGSYIEAVEAALRETQNLLRRRAESNAAYAAAVRMLGAAQRSVGAMQAERDRIASERGGDTAYVSALGASGAASIQTSIADSLTAEAKATSAATEQASRDYNAAVDSVAERGTAALAYLPKDALITPDMLGKAALR